MVRNRRASDSDLGVDDLLKFLAYQPERVQQGKEGFVLDDWPNRLENYIPIQAAIRFCVTLGFIRYIGFKYTGVAAGQRKMYQLRPGSFKKIKTLRKKVLNSKPTN